MATTYTAEKTWASGDVLTAADMNLYVRDNVQWLGTDKPIVRVMNSAAESIANNTVTTITFDTETFDNQNLHSTVTNTGRLTIPSGMDGKYLFTSSIEYAANATGIRNTFLQVNAATNVTGEQTSAASAGPTSHAVTAMYSMAATDFMQVRVTQTSGGALNVTTTNILSPVFTAHWVST